ncbi:MAG: hypothetical protein AB2L13_21020 [Spirochaetota bacterium]
MKENGKNVIEKCYYDFKDGAASAQPNIRFFSAADQANGLYTNWSFSGSRIGDKYNFDLYKIGFALRMKNGALLANLDVAKIMMGTFRFYLGNQEVRVGTLAEFFKAPVEVATSTAGNTEDGTVAFLPLLNPEPIGPGDELKFIVDIPALSGVNVQLGAFLKGIEFQPAS